MMKDTAFKVGQEIKACSSVQGMKAGHVYRVEKIKTVSLAFGDFLTYFVQPVDDRVLCIMPISNAHLVCQAV